MQHLRQGAPGGELTWLGPIDSAATGSGLPLAMEAVAAGFPSPADDYVEASIDLNTALIPRPTSTFLMRVEGDAMRSAGIHHGDLLVIDRSVSARPGCTVVAVHEGRFVLRHLRGDRPPWHLVASDPTIAPIVLQDSEPVIWGVVIHAVHHLLPRRRQHDAIIRNPGTAATPPGEPWEGTPPR
ncbi:LexA family transcriptional regulator [Cyanobium sp. NIES-981]|uniref:LexA family protein n=1 Tax=Cyanobium sp. NIES-981 TaxID=1851505 RepID=UPI0012FBF2A8|nr:translesion error-prone DNA polymerase V autoproteolytic subunit [Cyanobium sp. NIES-981]